MKANTVFTVELQGITLSPSVKKAIEADVQRAVLGHLAGVRIAGDLAISRRLGPGLAGMILESRDLKMRLAGRKAAPTRARRVG